MSDDFSMKFPRTELQEAVKGDRKQQLEAIRDYIAHELEGNLCNTCLNSRLRTGDQASLILRLQDVLRELDTLKPAKEGNRLAKIRELTVVGGTDTEVVAATGKSQQRRTSSRRVGEDNRSHP